MGTKRWIGGTSGDITTASNYAGGVVPSNGDVLLFDSSATGNVTSGFLGNTALQINIGRGFGVTIGTKLSAIILQDRFKNQDAPIDMRSGFANLTLLSPTVVVNSSPAGDSLIFTAGEISNLYVTGPTGNITVAADCDLTNLYVTPDRTSGPDPQCQVTIKGGAVTNMFISGPCVIDCSATVVNAIFAGPGLRVDVRENCGTGYLVVTGCRVRSHEASPVIGSTGGPNIVANGILEFARTTEQAALFASGTVDLMPGGLLDISNVPVYSSLGTIYASGGSVIARSPVTYSVPSDTKLSSTDFRSLNFSAQRNSGHVPTVLW